MKRTRWRCKKCDLLVEVCGEPDEMQAILDAAEEGFFKCPQCGRTLERALLNFFGEEDLGRHPDRFESAQEFWQFGTVGPKEERPSSPEASDEVVAELMSSPISMVSARNEEGRTIIDQINLENGTTLWLSASGLGAVVNRMRKGTDDASDRTDGEQDQQPERSVQRKAHNQGGDPG